MQTAASGLSWAGLGWNALKRGTELSATLARRGVKRQHGGKADTKTQH